MSLLLVTCQTILSKGSNKMEAQMKLKRWVCPAKVNRGKEGKFQLLPAAALQASCPTAKEVTNPTADGRRDDDSNTEPRMTWNFGLGKHTPWSQEECSSSPQGSLFLSWHKQLFFCHRFAYVWFLIQQCKRTENPTAQARSGLPLPPPSPWFAVPSYPGWFHWAPPAAAKQSVRMSASPRGTPASRAARGLERQKDIMLASIAHQRNYKFSAHLTQEAAQAVSHQW